MSSLTNLEKRLFEKVLNLPSGYVIDTSFTNQQFGDFFRDVASVDIFDTKYAKGSGSKANRLRAFWEMENDAVVGSALGGLLDIMQQDQKPISAEDLAA